MRIKTQIEKWNCIQGINLFIISLVKIHISLTVHIFISRFDYKCWSELRRPICVGSTAIWFQQRFNLSSRVNEESVVEEIEVIEFRLRYKRTRFGGSCDENCFNLLLLIHNLLKWRSDEISSGNCVNWFDDKSRNWSWESLLIWFEIWKTMRPSQNICTSLSCDIIKFHNDHMLYWSNC
jgi:hypothetical protein